MAPPAPARHFAGRLWFGLAVTGSLLALGDVIAQVCVEGRQLPTSLAQVNPYSSIRNNSNNKGSRRQKKVVELAPPVSPIDVEANARRLELAREHRRRRREEVIRRMEAGATLDIEALRDSRFDPLRTLRLALVGVAVQGPLRHFWYNVFWNSARAPVPFRLAGLRLLPIPVQRVLVDSVVFSPVNFTAFLSANELLRGRGVDAVVDKVRRDFVPLLTVTYSVWPALNLLNFAYVPAVYRVMYINVVSLFYNIFLSVIGNRPDTIEDLLDSVENAEDEDDDDDIDIDD